MDADQWNERYRQSDLLWTAEPNRWVVQETSGLAPGRALDLAAGEGRNAVWLAEQGWEVTAVDFVQTALDRGRARAEQIGERDGVTLAVTWELDDITTRELPSGAYDLVLLSYVHLPSYDRRELTRSCARAVAPGGTLLVVGHDATNHTEGYGGPDDPDVLYSAADLEDDVHDQLSSGSLELGRAGRVAREVETDEGPRVAWDVVFTAHRRDMGKGGFSFGD
ncbi:class I SAM-dependent methyltransferase [Agilicoccus flavus]|uniref:class I SAM-dependent methyltransferase n=1 Tax=Agilicoccus flavus TaxID=2775968 RepID=UPI001CF68332|nr:class I SAM-dependent methyltransferase [Agilicoccus flavus]